MKTTILIAVLGGLALTSTAQAVPISASASASPSGGRPEQVMQAIKRDQRWLSNEDFITNAAWSNLTEIEMSRMALSRSSDPKVRSLAEHLINDLSHANKELRHLANSDRIMMPAIPNRAQQRAIHNLEEKSGGDFDRAYLRQMSREHEDAVALYSNAGNSRSLDPRISMFANEKLPSLRMHQQRADHLSGHHTVADADDGFGQSGETRVAQY